MTSEPSHVELHSLAQFFAVRVLCDGVVLLTNDYKPAVLNYPNSALIYLVQTPKTRLAKADVDTLPDNIAVIPVHQLKSGFLKNKIFVCVDYIESHNSVLGPHGSQLISSIAEKSAMSIITAQKNTAWSVSKLQKSLKLNKTALFGEYKDEVTAISGRLTNVYGGSYPLLPILAVVSQFNEVDIIEPVVLHLLNQGVDVYVIDNWSNDGSYEAVEALAKRYPERVNVERFPKRNSGKYEWENILKRVAKIAKKRPQYKWIISNDADEIRWSPWPGITLQKAISFIDDLGFNVIDYTVFNFTPTKDGYKRGMDPLAFFDYGDFGHEGWHFMQLKTWKNHPKADIASSSGHLVRVPDPKIFPLKFFLGHYSLRSNAQASKKVFQDRKPRFLAKEQRHGWHSHYDRIKNNDSFIKDSAGLVHANHAQLPDSYLLQRLSGIGIKVNEINPS